MPLKPLFSSAPSFSLLPRASSSRQCIRSTYHLQQVRHLKYDTYEDRKQQARAWLAGEGFRFRRPAPDGNTNYLGQQQVRPKKENVQEGETPAESADRDPWADHEAVKKLKTEHNLSDEQLGSYISQHEGLTPDILGYILRNKLQGAEIREAIRDRKTREAANKFDSDEQARTAATKRVNEQSKKRRTMQSLEQEALQPFPNNPDFISEPVLSEELREIIYLKVKRDKLSVRTVSTLMGVSMERVGAVVRMKQIEREWVKEKKPLAVPYSKAVLDMLPTTEFINPSDSANIDEKTGKPVSQPQHEPINDLLVHPATTQQIFLSVPESQHFTRVEAGKAFHPFLKPADERIPHPELLAIEKFKLTTPSAPQLRDFTQSLIQKEQAAIEAKRAAEQAREEREVTVYQGKRWNFRFQDVSVDAVGKDGRNRSGVGWRYGMPHEDRKRGQVKIPTSVA